MLNRQRLGVLLGACGLGIFSTTFFTWQTINSPGGKGPHATGWYLLHPPFQGGFHLYNERILTGFFTLALGLIIILAALLTLFSRCRMTVGVLAIIAGDLACTGAVFNLVNTNWIGTSLSDCQVVVGRGYGLWVLLVFSILAVLVGLVLLMRRDRKTEDQIAPTDESPPG